MEANLTIPAEGSAVPAFFASPDAPSPIPGVIVIHEIWGLNDDIRGITRRLAAEGYAVLAPDLFAGTAIEHAVGPQLFQDMQDPEKKDDAQKKMRAALAPMQSPEFAEQMMRKLHACFERLHETCGNIAVMGFCFGGTYSFMLAAGEPRVKAALPFYGHPPASDRIAAIHCPVLAFYGEQDEPLMQSLPSLTQDMRAQGKSFEPRVYAGCGHAFFNKGNPRRYNKEAADDAWEKTKEFLRKHLS